MQLTKFINSLLYLRIEEYVVRSMGHLKYKYSNLRIKYNCLNVSMFALKSNLITNFDNLNTCLGI